MLIKPTLGLLEILQTPHSTMGTHPLAAEPAPPNSTAKSTQRDTGCDRHLHSACLQLHIEGNGSRSANKVHDDKVQDGAGKEEISKGSLWRDALEIRLVLGVDLYSQAHWVRNKTQKSLSRSIKQTISNEYTTTSHDENSPLTK